MADPKILAQNLEKITGAPFIVKEGAIECEAELSPAQWARLTHVCMESGLRMQKKTAIHPSGKTSDLPEIPVGVIHDNVAAAIAHIARITNN